MKVLGLGLIPAVFIEAWVNLSNHSVHLRCVFRIPVKCWVSDRAQLMKIEALGRSFQSLGTLAMCIPYSCQVLGLGSIPANKNRSLGRSFPSLGTLKMCIPYSCQVLGLGSIPADENRSLGRSFPSLGTLKMCIPYSVFLPSVGSRIDPN